MSKATFQTREQRYANSVYGSVDSYRKELEKTLKETDPQKRQDALKTAGKPYGSLAHKLPVLIRSAGLAQALAFVQARHKDNTPQRILLQHLNAAVGKGDLVILSRTAPLDEYMYLTAEVLAALLWFKRYAQSVLGVESGASDQESDHD